MDGFFESGEQSCSVETGWDQIEKRLMNSAVMHSTSHEAVQICKNLTENKEYITTSQYNAMVGIKSEHTCLDPNIVMDLRHSKVSFKFKNHLCAILNDKKSNHFSKKIICSTEKIGR